MSGALSPLLLQHSSHPRLVAAFGLRKQTHCVSPSWNT
jgi:hypothetical protein